MQRVIAASGCAAQPRFRYPPSKENRSWTTVTLTTSPRCLPPKLDAGSSAPLSAFGSVIGVASLGAVLALAGCGGGEDDEEDDEGEEEGEEDG